jgi:hypothetical protein
MIVYYLLLTVGISIELFVVLVINDWVLRKLLPRRHYCAHCAVELTDVLHSKTRKQIEEDALYETREP